MAAKNTRVLFKEYVDDGPITPANFEVDVSQPVPEECGEGEAIARLVVLSVDPYMRGRMRYLKKAAYFVDSFTLGQPADTFAIARIVKSRSDKVKEGQLVSGLLPMEEVAVLSAARLAMARVLEPVPGLALSAFIGPLGLTGLTAHCSLSTIAQPRAGEVAFVSGAAGAVGYVAGQLLKHKYECRVIGSAGTDEKVKLLTEKLGFDAAFNYRTTRAADALEAFAPDGVDIYFDNVGGQTLDDALAAMRSHGRVVMCGTISQYDAAPEKRYGVKNMFSIVTKSLKVQGFLLHDFSDEVKAAAVMDLIQLMAEGKVANLEWSVPGGLAAAPQAFVDMMAGRNVGKTVVWVSEAPQA